MLPICCKFSPGGLLGEMNYTLHFQLSTGELATYPALALGSSSYCRVLHVRPRGDWLVSLHQMVALRRIPRSGFEHGYPLVS